ncbi:NFATC2IP family protein [Megaselia abdita]
MSKKYEASDFAFVEDFDICAGSSPELSAVKTPILETDDYSSPQTPAPPKPTVNNRGTKLAKIFRKTSEEIEKAEKVPEPDPEYIPELTSSRRGRGRRQKSKPLKVTSETLDESHSSASPPSTSIPTRKSPRNTQKGRARRSYMSEVASRATVLDSIDLSEPQIKITSNIYLGSSDSDSDVHITKENTSIEEDVTNPEIRVKIKWMGGIETFKLRKFQKFQSIMEDLAKREDTQPECVSLNLKEMIINSEDTPESINYKFVDFIEGRILKSRIKVTKVKDLNDLDVKIQSDRWKKPMMFTIKKNQPFKVLCIKLTEELKASSPNDFKLRFDGDFLNMNQTPEQNDFEGGECLDLIFNK